MAVDGGNQSAGSGDRTTTASVLVADIVGSTEHRTRLGEEAADQFWVALESRLVEVATSNHGRVVKSLGDGVLVVFTSAAEAVGAAASMQQACSQPLGDDGTGVALRIGVSAGDVAMTSGDVFGTPVVEASRLCGAAQPGQILVADIVRSLSRGRGSHVFEPVGDLDLKGLPEPVPACQVVWQPLVAEGDAAGSVPLPGLLSAGIAASYVGRDQTLGHLSRLWNGLGRGGGSRAVLLSGEPGIGKTRTATEIARLAHGEAGVVLYGRCDEGLGVPFQPFVEALDYYTSNKAEPELGRLAGELSRLCPEVRERVAGLPEPVTSDPQTEEYRLFEAVTSWLLESSKDSGLVLILDDLHWATKATLLLLLHVLKGAAADPETRLLVVGTYRDTELDRSHPLNAVLADLRRLPHVERMDLGGLTFDETLALVESAAGHALDEPGLRLAHAAYAETEGNPFFVGEVLRHFVETGQVRLVEGRWEVSDPGHVEVPEGVRDVVGRRLGRLSETANQVLSVASVIGRDFDLELLGWVVDLDEMAVLDALDDASRARMVEETGPEQFRFFHAMVRDTLYEELSAARRRRLHHRVVEVLEKLRPFDLIALAHHSLEAGPSGGDMGRAVSYLLEAARQSADARDLSGAQRFYEQALEILDGEEPDPLVRLETLCGLGEVQRDQSNPAYRETLLEAGRRAIELGQADLAARACIANFRGFSSVVSAVDEERVGVLRSTIEAMPDEHGPQWALVSATLAAEVIYDRSVSAQERLALVDGALAVARSAGEPRLVAEVIMRVYQAALVPDRWQEAKALSDEMLGLAAQIPDPTIQALARLVGASGYLGLGDIARAESLVSEAREIAERDCPPFVLLTAQANLVQYNAYAGRMEDAERLNTAVQTLGHEIGMVDVDQWCLVMLASFEGVRGRLGDLADLAGAFADQYPGSVAWRCAHARALAEAGRMDETRDLIRRFGLDRPAEFPIDPFVLTGWAHLATVASFLRDRDLGEAVQRVLQPYEGLWIHYVLYVPGPVVWTLGLTAAAQQRWDEAIGSFETAIDDLTDRGMLTNAIIVSRDFALSFIDCPSADHRQVARRRALEAASQASVLAGFESLVATMTEAADSLNR